MAAASRPKTQLGMEDLAITVINLDQDSQRLSRIRAQLRQQGLGERWERFRAVESHGLDERDVLENCTEFGASLFKVTGNKPFRGSISLPSLACALSWKRIIREINRPTLVMEDDALLCEGFGGKVQCALKSLPSEWDVAYLSWNPPCERETIGVRVNDHVEKITTRLHGTGALVIQPRCRDLLLSIFPLDLQIDHDLPDKLIQRECIQAYALTHYGKRLIFNDNFGGTRTQI